MPRDDHLYRLFRAPPSETMDDNERQQNAPRRRENNCILLNAFCGAAASYGTATALFPGVDALTLALSSVPIGAALGAACAFGCITVCRCCNAESKQEQAPRPTR